MGNPVAGKTSFINRAMGVARHHGYFTGSSCVELGHDSCRLQFKILKSLLDSFLASSRPDPDAPIVERAARFALTADHCQRSTGGNGSSRYAN